MNGNAGKIYHAIAIELGHNEGRKEGTQWSG